MGLNVKEGPMLGQIHCHCNSWAAKKCQQTPDNKGFTSSDTYETNIPI